METMTATCYITSGGQLKWTLSSAVDEVFLSRLCWYGSTVDTVQQSQVEKWFPTDVEPQAQLAQIHSSCTNPSATYDRLNAALTLLTGHGTEIMALRSTKGSQA